LEDFAKLLEDFERYGSLYVAEEELRKILTNFPALENGIELGIKYWNAGLYQQSGIEWGEVVGIMVKP
jgi:hypothetical protein